MLPKYHLKFLVIILGLLPKSLALNKRAAVLPPSSIALQRRRQRQRNASPSNPAPPRPASQPSIFSQNTLADVSDTPSGVHLSGQP